MAFNSERGDAERCEKGEMSRRMRETERRGSGVCVCVCVRVCVWGGGKYKLNGSGASREKF